MTHLLQIPLGILPAILLLLIVTLVTRKKILRNTIVMVLLAAVAVGGLVIGLQRRSAAENQSKQESAASLELVYAMLSTGDTQGASKLLDEISGSTLYVNDYALCGARIHALSGNYTAAKLLYEKAMAGGADADSLAGEYDLVCACLSDAMIDSALYGHLAGYGEDIPDIDALLSAADDARSRVKDTVAAAVDAQVRNSKGHLVEAVDLIHETDDLYADYLKEGQLDPNAAGNLLKRMKALEKSDPALSRQSLVRIARLKAQVLNEDFPSIAKSVDDYADYNELLVVSELYINGYISSGSFDKSFGTEDAEMFKALYDQLQKLYNTYYSKESAAVRRTVKAYLDDLQYYIKKPALAKIQKMMEAAAANGADESTKIYLQLSRLAQRQGSDSIAKGYLTEALNTVGSSSDGSYTGPMYEIIGIIENKDDTESLKHIAEYVDAVVNNATTIELRDELKQPSEGSGDAGSSAVDFNTYMSDYVSQKRASINIINLDASAFPSVSMEIAVDSDIAYDAQRLQAALALKDCGAEITNFTVSDITCNRVNIVLVCDTSGSMEGSAIANLRDAVRLFLGDKEEKEHIGLILFDSSVHGEYGLDTDVGTLSQVVDGIRASGGTNMYDAVLQAISMLKARGNRADEQNIIILLSDGYDNNYHSVESIAENICAPCRDAGIVLYSIGLGESVDSGYLDAFASETGGDYLYVSDSQTLSSFYQYLHNLIANRYRVDFTALDTFTPNRTAKLSIKDDELAYDTWNYSLYHTEEGNLTDRHTIILNDKSIAGLETRVLYQTNKDQTVNLLCSNFTSKDIVTVTMMGGHRRYEIPAFFKDESHYVLEIPRGMSVGTYDMIVNVNGYIAYFEQEFTLANDEQAVRFGPYTFTGAVKTTAGDTITLSGGVCMNDWLYFRGSVTFTGDPAKDSKITLSDTAGCYIRYNATTATGFAKYLAENNLAISIDPLGTVTLCNDPFHAPSDDEYEVEPAVLPGVTLTNLVTFASPGLKLYPDRIVLDSDTFTTKFPYQDDLIKKATKAITKSDDLFTFDFSAECILTSKTVGAKIEYSSKESLEENKYKPVNFGSMPIYVNKSNIDFKIDTLKSEFYIKYMAKMAFIKADGLGLSLKWSGSLIPTEVKFYCDKKLTTTFGGVPVTFDKFVLGLSDISKKDSENVIEAPWKWTFSGKTDISVAKVSDKLPGLEEYVGDVSVMTFSDTTLSLRLSEFHIKLSTKAKLFGKLDVGSCVVEAGKLSYTNLLLNMKNEVMEGLRAEVEAGPSWKSTNCDIWLQGSLELALTDKVIGLKVAGDCGIEVKWWVFKKGKDIHGEGMVGMYKDHSNDIVFTVRGRSTGDKKGGVNVSWSKRKGGSVDLHF